MTDVAVPTWAHWTDPSWIEVDGLRTAYRRRGEGPTLLYLHGAGLTRAWLPLYEALSAGCDVVVAEHPGFGDTPMPAWLAGIDDLVLHYDALIRELALTDVHLAGHSLGGWLAASLAIFYPERFGSLSLISPMGLRVPEAPMADPFRLSPELAMEMLLGSGADAYAEYFDRGEEIDAMVANYAELITFARLLWNPRYDVKLERRLARIAIPTQLIGVDDDRLVPGEHTRRWAERIPGAQLVQLTGSAAEPTGHLSIIQQPAKLAALLVAHVDSSSPS